MIKLLLKLTAVTAALAIAFSAAGPVDAKKDGKEKRGTLVQVDAGQLIGLGAGRVTPLKILEFFRLERVEDGLEPRRAFGVKGAGIVLYAGGVGENQRRHLL